MSEDWRKDPRFSNIELSEKEIIKLKKNLEIKLQKQLKIAMILKLFQNLLGLKEKNNIYQI